MNDAPSGLMTSSLVAFVVGGLRRWWPSLPLPSLPVPLLPVPLLPVPSLQVTSFAGFVANGARRHEGLMADFPAALRLRF